MSNPAEVENLVEETQKYPKGAKFAAAARQYLKLVRDLRRRDSENTARIGSELLRSHRGILTQDELWTIHEQVAIAAMDVHSMDLAFSLVQAVRNKFPKSARAERLTGLYFEGKGTLKEANNVYSRFEDAFPEHELLEKRKIALERAKGSTAGAISLLQKWLDTNQMDKDAWEELADLYLQAQMYSQAAHCMEELLLHSPSNIAYLVQYADILYTMGGSSSNSSSSLYRTALAYYSAAIEISEGHNVRALYGACACSAQLAGSKTRNQAVSAAQPEIQSLAGRQLIDLYKAHSPDKLPLVEGLLKMQTTSTPSPSLTAGSAT